MAFFPNAADARGRSPITAANEEQNDNSTYWHFFRLPRMQEGVGPITAANIPALRRVSLSQTRRYGEYNRLLLLRNEVPYIEQQERQPGQKRSKPNNKERRDDIPVDRVGRSAGPDERDDQCGAREHHVKKET